MPDRIDLKKFLQTEGRSCTPFKNCLDGLNVKMEEIKEIVSDSNNSAAPKLEDKLNEKINKKIKEIWEDFNKENQEIVFKVKSDYVSVNIKHTNSYDHKSLFLESDGYKQFFSILFTINFTNKKNMLLLIDEPEIHLHPSGVIDLKKILYNFSDSNYLVISTHSVYLIDIANLEKYYFIEKKEKVSSIKNVQENSYSFPDLVIQAFGTDIFSNFMFKKFCFFVEGLTDLKILEKILGDKIKDFLIIIFHGDNVIPYIMSYKKMYPEQYFQKNCFVLIDSDKSGLSNKDKLLADNIICESNIITTDDIFPHNLGTIEDCYKTEKISLFESEMLKCKNKNQIKDIKAKFCENQENYDEQKIKMAKKKILEKIKYF